MHTSDEPLENLLFEFRGADLILRSRDNQHFRVPKCYIINSSPVLDEQIQDALDAPEDAHGEAQLPLVQLPESGEILRNLLTFIFPVTPVLPSSAEEIMELLSVANKYQMVSAMDHIRNRATTENKLFPRRETTLIVYSLAQTYGLPFEALRAAMDSVSYSMDIEDLEDELAVAKIEVGPWAPGRFYHTVYSTACASAHFIVSSPFSGLLHRLGTVDSHLSYHTDT